VQIGRHIFYRLPSVLGESRSFFQHYAGKEPEIPKPDEIVTLPEPATSEALATALVGDAVDGPKEVEKAAEPAAQLAIDASRGTLLADQQAPTIQARRPKASSECAAASDRKQLAPIGANDLRAGVSVSNCD